MQREGKALIDDEKKQRVSAAVSFREKFKGIRGGRAEMERREKRGRRRKQKGGGLRRENNT